MHPDHQLVLPHLDDFTPFTTWHPSAGWSCLVGWYKKDNPETRERLDVLIATFRMQKTGCAILSQTKNGMLQFQTFPEKRMGRCLMIFEHAILVLELDDSPICFPALFAMSPTTSRTIFDDLRNNSAKDIIDPDRIPLLKPLLNLPKQAWENPRWLKNILPSQTPPALDKFVKGCAILLDTHLPKRYMDWMFRFYSGHWNADGTYVLPKPEIVLNGHTLKNDHITVAMQKVVQHLISIGQIAPQDVLGTIWNMQDQRTQPLLGQTWIAEDLEDESAHSLLECALDARNLFQDAGIACPFG